MSVIKEEVKSPAADPKAKTADPAPEPIKQPEDPLTSTPVNEKSYTGSSAQKFTPEQLQVDIPDFIPDVPPPTPGDQPKAYGPPGSDNGGGSTSGGSAQPKQEKKPFNPDLKDLSDSEKSDKAKKMAMGILRGYKLLNMQGEKYVKISQKRINKLQMNGEVDLTINVPWEMGETVQLSDFFNEYNKSCDGVFAVTPEFENDVMPPLTRVLAKRGHGWSDEQSLLFMFGEDLVTKAMQFRELRSSLSQVISFAREQTEATRHRPQTRPAPMAPQPAAAQAYQPSAPVAAPATAPIHVAQDPVIQQPQASTLQQEALNKNIIKQGGSTNLAMPTYGNPKRMKGIDKVAKEQVLMDSGGKTTAKTLIKKHSDIVANRPTANVVGVPTGGKKKAGRPKGAKNKFPKKNI